MSKLSIGLGLGYRDFQLRPSSYQGPKRTMEGLFDVKGPAGCGHIRWNLVSGIQNTVPCRSGRVREWRVRVLRN